MRNLLRCTGALALTAGLASAQLSGNYTIDPSGPAAPPNYQTFAAATAALGAGVSGPVTFLVAPVTFNESVTLPNVASASATNTITFIGNAGRATINAGSATGLTINAASQWYHLEQLEVKGWSTVGVHFNGASSGQEVRNCSMTDVIVDGPASSSISVQAIFLNQSDDNTFTRCKFMGGGRALYSQGMDRTTFESCEFDGKNLASRVIDPYNANDSDCLFQNCFAHSCGPNGYVMNINVSGYGIMFWHNTLIGTTAQQTVRMGGCCAWSRANSFRNNIVVNNGTGAAIFYGHRNGVLDFNDLDYNCYWAPNSTNGAIQLENGTGFTQGSLAQWKTYFAATPSLVPVGGGSTWDQNSIEADPGLVSMTAPFDIHLTSTSPCLDSGTTTYIAGTWISFPASIVATDFEGEARPTANVDIGADEVAGLIGNGSGKVGTTMQLSLTALGDIGLPYQLGSSFGTGPIPVDSRVLRLSIDKLLEISVNGVVPQIFAGYVGSIPASGKASAGINIPNFPILAGLPIHTAFITLDGTAPSGIRTISNTFSFVIQP